MADIKLELTQEAEQNIAQTLDTLIEAANEIAKASEQDFEKLKSKKWYKRLWELVTYSRDNEKIQARGVANLAKLNEIIMKAIVLLSKQNEETAELVYHSLEEIKALQSDVGNIYNSLDKVIETLICIKRGFKSETRFDELSDSSKDIICALVFKFAEENNFNNSETQQLLYILKTNAHTASVDIEYDCVDNLDLDAQKVLYSILQAYVFLFKNDFDDEENSEIFDSLSLSKKDKERQKEVIKKEIKLLGTEGYINLLESSAEEYEFDDFITDEYIEFIEIPAEEEEKPLYDFSALRNLIRSHIDLDENGVSASFGQLITDVAKYTDIFEILNAVDLSNDAVIAIFKAQRYLAFTTYGIYYENWEKPIPYCELDPIKIKKVIKGEDAALKITPDNEVYDSVIDEEKLLELVIAASNLDNSAYSITDRNILFDSLDENIHKSFFAVTIYILKSAKENSVEAFRNYLDGKYKFVWTEALEIAEAIQSKEDYEAMVESIFNAIPYPSEKSVSCEMLNKTLKILLNTTMQAEVSIITEELIKKLDKNNMTTCNFNLLISSICARENYAKGLISAETYKNIQKESYAALKGIGVGLAAGVLFPIAAPFALMGVISSVLGATAFAYRSEEKYSRKVLTESALQWELMEDVLKSYKNLNKELPNYPKEVFDMYFKIAYNKLDLALSEMIPISISENLIEDDEGVFNKAFIYDAPEILFGYEKLDNKPIFEDIKTAENLYYAYRIEEALELFKFAAGNGCGRACYYLGEIYAWGYGDITKDRDLAEEWRKKGMMVGDVLSTLNYTYMQTDAALKEKVFWLVLPMLEKLAEQDDVAAQYELSDMYYKGLGTTASQSKGFYWLKKSANLGHFKSMNKLACLYWTKKGGAEKNKDEAVRLWKMAANLCYEPAVYNIFKRKALSEYKIKFDQICSNGYAPALNYRAYLQLNGFDGYAKFPAMAYKDLKSSADRGNLYAKENYAKYVKKGKLGGFSVSYEIEPIY